MTKPTATIEIVRYANGYMAWLTVDDSTSPHPWIDCDNDLTPAELLGDGRAALEFDFNDWLRHRRLDGHQITIVFDAPEYDTNPQ